MIMKVARIITSLIIACILFSMWPSNEIAAQAKNEPEVIFTASNGGYDIPKVAYVTAINNTGGILYVELKAVQYKKEPLRRSYAFGFPEQGKIRFQILPGRFTYTIRSSNCGGKRINTKFFTGETFLGIYTCDKKGG
jgi:hypothetical protein